MKLYHYRSISSALLEIENGTFHFASKEELNDPLEGFVRVFWQGDKMAWEGLFRHYIYSVARALKRYIMVLWLQMFIAIKITFLRKFY